MVITSETPAKRIKALTAHVAPELAAEIRRLAEAGNRSVSREVSTALRRHVAEQILSERRAPDSFSPAVEAPAHGAGDTE